MRIIHYRIGDRFHLVELAELAIRIGIGLLLDKEHGREVGSRCCRGVYATVDELRAHFEGAHRRSPRPREISDLTVCESCGLVRYECLCPKFTLPG